MKAERWKQVEQIYQSALKCEVGQRAVFLAEVCAGDDSLRREVESLLAHQSQAEDLMETPVMEIVARVVADSSTTGMIGRRVGHYQILSLLGKGGMGEVYRARDTRLSREVAIKILPSEYSADADRLRRFEQEARAAGMLNHPNILTIHDIGADGRTPYIVSEMLAGATLREQMQGAALPLSRAMDYAAQIARGLAAAHEKGIVHRDLKPENLFITKDGRAKILDFGLAKLRNPLPGVAADTDAPTRALQTDSGVVMGTVGYMSPEQVRAEEVDHRSDIFAFGAILYEMLCGRRAFPGSSAVEVMNAILKEEPPEITEQGREIPPTLQRAMKHCLEKNQADRFQSINDVAFYLDALPGVSDSASASRVQVSEHTKSYQRLGWIVAAVLLLVTILLFVYFRRAPEAVVAVRFSVPPPEKATGFAFPSISPDGRHLAFVVTADGKTLLWVRRLGSLDAQPLPGTDSAVHPFWSPDSQQI